MVTLIGATAQPTFLEWEDETFRIKGRGVPSTGGTGDLLVTVVVDVPGELTAAQRAAIEALDQATTTSPRDRLLQAAGS